MSPVGWSTNLAAARSVGKSEEREATATIRVHARCTRQSVLRAALSAKFPLRPGGIDRYTVTSVSPVRGHGARAIETRQI